MDIGSLFKLAPEGRRFALRFPPPVPTARNPRGPIRRQTAHRAGRVDNFLQVVDSPFCRNQLESIPSYCRFKSRYVRSRGAKKTAARIATNKPRQHQKASEASGRNPSTASGDDGSRAKGRASNAEFAGQRLCPALSSGPPSSSLDAVIGFRRNVPPGENFFNPQQLVVFANTVRPLADPLDLPRAEPTARSAMVVSSVSPERWLITDV